MPHLHDRFNGGDQGHLARGGDTPPGGDVGFTSRWSTPSCSSLRRRALSVLAETPWIALQLWRSAAAIPQVPQDVGRPCPAQQEVCRSSTGTAGGAATRVLRRGTIAPSRLPDRNRIVQ